MKNPFMINRFIASQMGMQILCGSCSQVSKKQLCDKFRQALGDILKQTGRQNRVELLKGHSTPDYIHVYLSLPPRFSTEFVIGLLKDKRGIRIHREIFKIKRVTHSHSWIQGYCVSTIGFDEEAIRKCM